MEKAQDAVSSAIEGVKKVAIGEKKPKVKKPKAGDSGKLGKCLRFLHRSGAVYDVLRDLGGQ